MRCRRNFARRKSIEQRYGVAPDSPWNTSADAENIHIPAIGDFGEDKQRFEDVIGDDKHPAFSADPNEAIEELIGGGYKAAVVAVAADEAVDKWLTMCADIRDNPGLHNVPILMVADDRCFSDPTVPFKRGVTDLLHWPIDGDNLCTRLSLLINK